MSRCIVPCAICQTRGACCCLLAGLCLTRFTRFPPSLPLEASSPLFCSESWTLSRSFDEKESTDSSLSSSLANSDDSTSLSTFPRCLIKNLLRPQNHSRSFLELPGVQIFASSLTFFPILPNSPHTFSQHDKNKMAESYRRSYGKKTEDAYMEDW